MASDPNAAIYRRGDDALAVPMTMFADNRRRLCEQLRQQTTVPAGAYVLLQGGTGACRYPSSDIEPVFRQESYFHWTFGVEEEACYGAVNVESGVSTLFMPRHDEDYGIWVGKVQPLSHYKEKYGIDQVYYSDEMDSLFTNGMKPSVFLLLKGINPDNRLEVQPASYKGIEKIRQDTNELWETINQCRVIKSPQEIELLRYVSKISMDAHKKIMKEIKAGMYEFQIESLFKHYTQYFGGARIQAYNCICATGENGSVLHFVTCERKFEDGDMCLFDMGAEYCCYASDITCSFPVNGKFTDDQKLIYNAVLDANLKVMEAMKPGVSWVAMHKLAEKTVLSHLLTGGLLTGSVDEMVEARVGALFMPHGLGHFMGVDVHDCGGYPEGTERINEPGLRSLRTVRNLEAGMVITVEPGCYFIDHVLDKAFANPELSKYLVKDQIQRFRGTGGVRIEDDVLVTSTGCENLSGDLPRTVEAIEAFMAE